MREKNNKEKLIKLIQENPKLPIMFFADTEDSRILDFSTTVYEEFNCEITEVYDCEEKGYFTDVDDIVEDLTDIFCDDKRFKDLSDDEFYKKIKKYINENIRHFKAIIINIY